MTTHDDAGAPPEITPGTRPIAPPAPPVDWSDVDAAPRGEAADGRSSEEHFRERVKGLLGELLDSAGLDSMPSLTPLIGDLLYLNTLSRIIGPSGHMKSFVLIDFAGHVGTGLKWHGHHTRQGTVVYLVAEGAEGIRKRVRAWEQHHGLVMENVLFLPRPVQANSPEWAVLVEALKQIGPALIIVDTQARVTVGVDENSNTEMGIIIHRLERLRADTGACVALVHHTGHVGEHGRGASSVKGAVQTELHVSKKGDRASNTIVTIKTGKQKDEEQGTDLQFGLKVVSIDGEYKPDGRPVTSVVLLSLDAAPAADQPALEGSIVWIANQLDNAGVPADWGRRRLRDECVRLGIQVRDGRLQEVANLRKAATGDRFPDRFPVVPDEAVPGVGTGTGETTAQTGSAPVGHQSGTGTSTPVVPSLPPGREPVVNPKPECSVCHLPLSVQWASQGHDRHVMC